MKGFWQDERDKNWSESMSSFVPKFEKTAEDGSEIRLVIDGHHAWFVERPEDREAHAHPMGAFNGEAFARAWADREFPGGDWKPVE
jgi:dienelactone hydrolase